MEDSNESKASEDRAPLVRRKFLLGGLLASLGATYGLFASFAVRFIFPKRKPPRLTRVFICFADDIAQGESKSVLMPSGDELLISNTGRLNAATGNTLVAFSNSCPHLGCKVQWEAREERFFCPCHQGVFDPVGVAISGPPAQSGSNLREYRIEVGGNSIYALVDEV